MAATFLQTNFNTQDPTTYRGTIDADWAVAAPIVGNFAPHAAATPNMTVLLDAGAIPAMGGMPVQIAQQTSATLTAPSANPRKDIVYIDSTTGVIGVATGTEAASPVDPAIPAGKIPVARLSMTVGMTTIPNTIITDLRAPVMASGGVKFATITANTTLTTAQSGMTFKLSGVAVTATLPTPIGNAGTRYRFIGTDANTQTLTTPAATINAPDATTSATRSITNNQVLDIESDGAVWRVMGMEGLIVAQTPATSDNSTKTATTAMVQALFATLSSGAMSDVITQNGNVTLSFATYAWKMIRLTSATAVYTFDTAVGNKGKGFWLQNATGDDAALRLVCNGAESIGSATGATIYIPAYTTIGFVSDGANILVFSYTGKTIWTFTANGTLYAPPGKNAAFATIIGGGSSGVQGTGAAANAGGTTSIGSLLTAAGASAPVEATYVAPASPNGTLGLETVSSIAGDGLFGSGATVHDGLPRAASGYGSGGASSRAALCQGQGAARYVNAAITIVPGTAYAITIGVGGAAGSVNTAGTAGIAILELN